MAPSRFLPVLALGLLTLAVPAVAQQARTAEVRTWDGRTWTLTEVGLRTFFTVLPPTAKDSQAVPQRTNGGRASTARLFGSTTDLKALLDAGPEPLLSHRPVDAITLVDRGGEVRVPVDRVASIAFFRHPVESSLPPYVEAGQRHAAAVVLLDGSRVESPYINLGTTVVRGTTSQGRVEVPWHEIEVLRFR